MVSPRDVAELIAKQFLYQVDEVLENSAIFSGGLLDSFNLVELMTELESNYSIRIKATEVNLDNFDSAERIAEFVSGKIETA